LFSSVFYRGSSLKYFFVNCCFSAAGFGCSLDFFYFLGVWLGVCRFRFLRFVDIAGFIDVFAFFVEVQASFARN
jgi:hypothetical protein